MSSTDYSDFEMESAFLYPFTYNWMLTVMSIAKNFMCVSWGMWGLLIYADMGEMMQNCYETGLQGGTAVFIVPE